MKKFLFVFLIIFGFISAAYAKNINFLNEEYELQFVSKNSENFINEYVRPTQTLSNWTNIITVHYFPNISSEKDYLNHFMNYINNNPQSFIIKYFPELDLFSYGIGSLEKGKESGYIEYNVLRASKNSQKGIEVLQFGHKYKFKDKESFKDAYERCFKYNMKYVNALMNTKIPPIEKTPYEKR